MSSSKYVAYIQMPASPKALSRTYSQVRDGGLVTRPELVTTPPCIMNGFPAWGKPGFPCLLSMCYRSRRNKAKCIPRDIQGGATSRVGQPGSPKPEKTWMRHSCPEAFPFPFLLERSAPTLWHLHLIYAPQAQREKQLFSPNYFYTLSSPEESLLHGSGFTKPLDF